MSEIPFFKPKVIDYPEHLGFNEPVRYTESFLKDIAEKTESVDLTDGHDGEIIGCIDGFHMKGDVLYCSKPDVDLNGKGLSPVFDVSDLIVNDGVLDASNGVLTSVAVTSNPRSHIFYNSEVKKQEENIRMSEDNMDKLFNMNSKLEKENATLEHQLNSQSKALKESKKKEKELEELKEAYEKLQEEIKAYAPKAESYDKIVESQKEELLDKLAGDKEEVRKKLENWSMEQLRDFESMRIINKPPRGVNAEVSEGMNLGDGEEVKSEEDEYSYEDFKKDYRRAYGTDPDSEF